MKGMMIMPRGRKPAPKTFEEQLALIDSQIAEHRQAVDLLKSQRKEVLAAKDHADMSELLSAVRASGKTPGDFIAALRNEEVNDEE